MFAPEDIVNDALALIGDDGIGSFTDDDRGRDAGRIYRNEIAFAIGVHPFSWARRMFLLSRAEGTPSTGHAYLYALPPERVGPPLRITDDATDDRRIFNCFELLGGFVATDAEAVWASCKIVPDPAEWSSTFRQTVIVALAGRFAYARSTDKDMQDRFLRQAYGTPDEAFRGGLMRAAIQEDGRATPPRRMPTEANPLLAAWGS